MASHSSATTREPHVNRTTRTNTILNALTRRAQAVLNDKSIDAESRAIIRYALETNDPWLAELVRRADAGENVVDDLQSIETNEEARISALAEIICRVGEHTAAALLVLMSKIDSADHPKRLVKIAKHCAFTRCGELNNAQIALIENELLRE